MLTKNTSWEGFTNTSKNILASEDENTWINMLSFREQNHRDEFGTKMSSDKECQNSYEEFTNLITPGSQIITGEFKRLVWSKMK